MKILIDFDEETYEVLKHYTMPMLSDPFTYSMMLQNAVVNGTVLPKAHGRLIDADKYKEHIFRVFPCDNADDRNIRRATELGLECAPTVIPADKEMKNEKAN